ncbi:MAG: DUF177 domain-containing protein [Rikenellaceae bacterium]
MDMYCIDYKTLSLGEHSFNFKVGGELFELYGYPEILGAKLDAEIKMRNMGSSMDLDIEITGVVTVECDRCLDPLDIEIQYQTPLIVKLIDTTEIDQEDSDGDIMWLARSEKSLDLTQYIYESVILSLPMQRVHPIEECNADMMDRFSIITQEEEDALEV